MKCFDGTIHCAVFLHTTLRIGFVRSMLYVYMLCRVCCIIAAQHTCSVGFHTARCARLAHIVLYGGVT